ncbi:MAG: hypothetical protein Q4E88_05820 [Coriobacteriia bacterium]|nr:hypothetical protein [Coriobacteriia bacterium]
MNPLIVTKRWRKYCDRNNIKYIPFGNMRSVYATLCAEAECVDSIVCKTMRHCGGSIKEKNYQAATLNALKFNADMLAEYINFKYTTPEEIIDNRDK